MEQKILIQKKLEMISKKLYHELRLMHYLGISIIPADFVCCDSGGGDCQITGSFDPIDADTADSASARPNGSRDPSPSPKHYRFGSGEPIGIGNPDHLCEEGMTEIFGWMICKHCGKNLRQIK